jgi:cysteine desulfurase
MAVRFPIFMDAQSTTPADPRVVEAMLPYFTEKFGHPASRNHPFGWEAEAAVDRAREQIGALLGARDANGSHQSRHQGRGGDVPGEG